METEKKENQMNEESNAGAADLTDLPVTTGQTEEIKGGSLPGIHKVTDVTLKRGVVG